MSPEDTSVDPFEADPGEQTQPTEAEKTSAEPDNGNAEAAKWRRKLRDTEAALDTAHLALGMLRRTEIERVAAEHLAVPADLLDLGGHPVEHFLAEDGTVDPATVVAAAAELLTTRPGLRRVIHVPDLGQGIRGTPEAPPTTWGDVLQQKRLGMR